MDVLGSSWLSALRSCRHSATALSVASRQTCLFSIHTNTAVLYIRARDVQGQPDSELKLLLCNLTPINGNSRCSLTVFSLPYNRSALIHWTDHWNGSFGNRVSNGRGQWLDLRILKLELAFWLLTSLCLAQPYGIRVKVNKLPKSKQTCTWQYALYKENTKLIAWT